MMVYNEVKIFKLMLVSVSAKSVKYVRLLSSQANQKNLRMPKHPTFKRGETRFYFKKKNKPSHRAPFAHNSKNDLL